MQSETNNAGGRSGRISQYVGEVTVEGEEDPPAFNGCSSHDCIISTGEAQFHNRCSVMAQGAKHLGMER